MDEADDKKARRDGKRAGWSAPFLLTESDLKELEISEIESAASSPPSEARVLLDSLQAMLDRGQQRMVLSGAILGGLVAGVIIVLFILKLGLHSSMTQSSAIETVLIAAVITALFTCAAVAALPLERRQIDDWLAKFEGSLH